MWEFLITFWCCHRGQFRPSLGQKNIFFFNLTRILSFFWELTLTLFDIPKEVGFAKVLVFSNIFGFPDVNWVPKWNKTFNFGCLPVKLKFKSLKDFSNTVFVLLETTSGQNFSKIEHYLGEEEPRPENPKKGPFHGANQYKKLFLTSQPLMLYWWKLPQKYILIRYFTWQSLGA